MRNHSIRFWLFIIVGVILTGVLSGAGGVLAQTGNEPAGLKNVQLWLYPEYDDPRLLVMLEGQIAGAQPPAPVKFLVPSGAEMFSAGSMDIRGQYSGGPPARKPSTLAGWDEISYEVKTDTFRVEYYVPSIIGRTDKTIAFEYRWLYPVSGLSVIIQEPKGSSSYNVQPAGKISSDKGGFIIYQYQLGELKANEPLKYDISYQKSDPRTSLEIDPGAGKSPQNQGSSTPDSSYGVVILITVVALVVAGGLYLFVKARGGAASPRRRSKVRPAPVHRAKARARAQTPQQPKEKRTPEKVCEECGERIPGSAKYCPNCGEQQL